MTELSLNSNVAPLPGSPFERTQNKWKRPLLALLLSLLVPGLGQLYNRQPWKAMAVGLLLPAIYVPAGYLGALHHFASFVAFLVFQMTLVIVIATDAFRTARRQFLNGLPSWESAPVWRVAAFLLLIAPPAATSKGFLLDQVLRCRAYRVPSVSNCPTICKGERIIADPSAFRGKTPQRGDLVVFRHADEGALWIKRVIGLPGDIVVQSESGILVNGKPAALVDLAHVCGDPPQTDRAAFLPIQSKTLLVPADSLYVIGDNWPESLDSRTEEFGFVPVKNVRGRPLFLYWSPYKNRIGCRLQ